MAQASKSFDRMVRVDSNRYEMASVVARMEGLDLKAFVDLALREAIDQRQKQIAVTLEQLHRLTTPVPTLPRITDHTVSTQND